MESKYQVYYDGRPLKGTVNARSVKEAINRKMSMGSGYTFKLLTAEKLLP